jgi:hypothetical protein
MLYDSTPAPLQGSSINADLCMGSVMLNIRIDNAITRLILKEERKRKGTNRLLVYAALSS